MLFDDLPSSQECVYSLRFLLLFFLNEESPENDDTSNSSNMANKTKNQEERCIWHLNQRDVRDASGSRLRSIACNNHDNNLLRGA